MVAHMAIVYDYELVKEKPFLRRDGKQGIKKGAVWVIVAMGLRTHEAMTEESLLLCIPGGFSRRVWVGIWYQGH